MSTVRIQVRRGTEAQWALVNPILAAGEVGLESDTNYFKFGTGNTAWNALPYANEPLSDLENRVGAYLEDNLLGQPNGVASLNSSGKVPAAQLDITELSQDAVNTAITAGTGITKAYDDNANTITVSADTSVLATKLYAENYANTAISNLIGSAPSVLNTLDELAAALNDDANYAATITTALGTKADAVEIAAALDLKAASNAPVFTGTVVLPSTTSIGNVNETEIGYLNGVTSNIQTQIDDKAPIANATLTGTLTLPATTSIGTVSGTEIGYLSGLEAAAQVQLDAKAPIDAPVFTGNVSLPSTTSIGDVSNNEIAYLNGVTSGVQLQLDAKAPIESPTFTGTVSGITKAMVGLAEADDTSDADKPISTATQAALDTKAAAADLTSHATDTTNIHGITDTAALATKDYADAAVSTHSLDTTSVHGIADTSLLATTANVATAKTEAIEAAGTAADTKVSTAVAALTKSSVGLGNVDNTADSAKPVSTAQATAIATAKSEAIADATSQVNALLTGAPAALNTLDELAAALGDDANFASTVTTNLAAKAPINSPTFTGTVTVAAAGVAFTDGTQTKQGVPSQTVVVERTASFNANDADFRDQMIEVNHTGGSAVTITVPADGTNGRTYPVGTSIDILRTNTGAVTIAGSGATVNATPGLTLRARWSSATLFKRAANTWVLMGDLTA